MVHIIVGLKFHLEEYRNVSLKNLDKNKLFKDLNVSLQTLNLIPNTKQN
jgi:hypothetical protein